MWETERTSELMRRWTAVNHDPKYTQKHAMTQNIGMRMCVLPLRKQDTFQGNVL